MFRKITSKGDDANTTVFAEFKKEFGWVADAFIKKKDRLVANYPRQIFISMVAILIISFILRFTVLSNDHRHDQLNGAVLAPAIGAITKPTQQISQKMQILDSATTLRAEIQAVMFKDTMTRDDSIFIIESNKKLKQMENEINQL
jgi:hypothetical protein